jgi:hypothetical protein
MMTVKWLVIAYKIKIVCFFFCLKLYESVIHHEALDDVYILFDKVVIVSK